MKSIYLSFLLICFPLVFIAQEHSAGKAVVPEGYQQSTQQDFATDGAFTQDAMGWESQTPGFYSFPRTTGTPMTFLSSFNGLGGTVFIGAGEMLPNGDYYMMDENDNLFLVDPNTGSFTVQVATGMFGGESASGMAYHAPTNTMFVVSTDLATASLYTLDLGNAILTRIGALNNSCPINLAINTAGDMYCVDICNDALYQINPNTAASTYIGPIGFNANFGQGADFDDETGIMYYSAFNNNTFQAEYRTVNLSTGMTTFINVLATGAGLTQLSDLVIPTKKPQVPLSPLAIAIGIFLIVTATVIRFRRFS